uniref:RNA-dependent RNA polymerase n=1 Tax=Beihai barnacle virus 5 TaxID=1922363 RepID=A0A1L3KPH8_9VIRU|nr:RNA-dependent RNA polymerase [Beihai barnacle virus 5]
MEELESQPRNAHGEFLRDTAPFALVHEVFAICGERRERILFYVGDASDISMLRLDCTVLVSLTTTHYKSEEALELMSEENLYIARERLEKATLYNLHGIKTDRKCPRILDWPILEGTTLNMVIKIGMARMACSVAYLDFEPGYSDLVAKVKQMCAVDLSFPVTGLLDFKSIYVTDPEAAEEKMEATREAINSIYISATQSVSSNIRAPLITESLEDFETTMSTWSLVPLTQSKIDKYLRWRHDLVVRCVADNLNISDKSLGISANEYLGSTIPMTGRLTPDIIYERGAYINILDIAVTSQDVGEVANQKVNKYVNLARDLEDRTGKWGTPEAVVVSMDQLGAIYIPHFLAGVREELEGLQERLFEVHRRLMMTEGYEQEVRNLMEEGKDQDAEDLKRSYEIFCNTYTKIFNICNKKASSMADSFDKESSDMNINFNTTEQDEMIRKIKDDVQNFDEDAYYMRLKAELSDRCSSEDITKKCPSSIRKLLNTPDLFNIRSKLLDEAMEVRMTTERKEPRFKIPKVFKFPNLVVMKGERAEEVIPMTALGTLKEVTRDGTYRFRPFGKLYGVDRDEEVPEENRAGIGLDVGQDLEYMDRLLEDLTEPSSEEFQELMERDYGPLDDKAKAVFSLKAMEVCYHTEEMAMNLAYLEGRRFNKSSTYTVSKGFGWYSLVVLAGSRLTEEKQIRYKVLCKGEEYRSDLYKSFTGTMWSTEGCVETSWQTLSSSDLSTMLVLFEKACLLIHHLLDALEEGMERKIQNYYEEVRSSKIMIPLIILMEMKRGTSTTCQLNRYIYNSMMALISDKEKMMRDIMAEPIRSRVEAFVRVKQMEWALHLFGIYKNKVVESITASSSTATDYDKMMVMPLFGSQEEEVEFSFVMNDMYLGNLFQKEAGFTGHRVKPMIEKTVSEERHYLKIRNKETMNADLSIEEIFREKDENHKFNKDFVMLCAKEIKKKMMKEHRYEEMLAKKLTDSIQEAMTMKSSLCEFRTMTNTLEYSKDPKNKPTFLSLEEIVREAGTMLLPQLVSRESLIEALISMFPKSQIGGPREIMIQSCKLRVHIRLLEQFFEVMCQLHEKEMITKSTKKENIQSNTATAHKQLIMDTHVETKSKNRSPLMMTIVSDCSRWSQSFTMPMFSYFLVALDLPKDVEDHFLCTFKSMSKKHVMFPQALKKKWNRKPYEEKEGSEDLQWAREVSYPNDYVINVFSSMGQGVFHRFSSVIHCAKDDIMDRLTTEILTKENFSLTSRSMISSDDMMKQVLMIGPSQMVNFDNISKLAVLFEVTNRLCNIHINWKKTSFTTVLDEFNSYFSRGKRATMAVIKDIFNSAMVVDLTEPEKAVKACLNNISRAMRNGAYLQTVEMMFMMNRQWLLKCYAITEDMIKELCETLKCEKDHLPACLGFLSTRFPIEQCLLGNEFLMFEDVPGSLLSKFYRNLYTGIKDEATALGTDGYLTTLSGKISLSLPFWSDKRIRQMRSFYMDTHSLTSSRVMDRLERSSLKVDMSKMSAEKQLQFVEGYFMGVHRDYSMSSSKDVSSLVRALQMHNEKLVIKPDFRTDEDKGSRVSMTDFVKMILLRDNMPSCISMYEPYRDVMKSIEQANFQKGQCVKTDNRRHTKKRVMNMRHMNYKIPATIDEIMEMVVSPQKDISNRVVELVRGLCASMDIDLEKFMESPIREIMKVSDVTKWPVLTFKKVTEEFLKVNAGGRVEIMTTFQDKGTMVDNIISIYCDRKDPSTLYAPKSDVSYLAMRSKMQSWACTGTDFSLMPLASMMGAEAAKEEMLNISPSDGPKDRAVKLLYAVSSNNKKSMMSKYVFFKKIRARFEHQIIYCYFNLETFIVVLIDKRAKSAIIERLTDSGDRLMKCDMAHYLIRDFRAHEVMSGVPGSGANIKAFNRAGMLGPMDRIKAGRIDWTLETTFLKNKWDISVKIDTKGSHILTPDTVLFKVSSDVYSYTIDDLLSFDETVAGDFAQKMVKMCKREMNLEEVMNFAEENGMAIPITLPRGPETQMNEQAKEEMNSSFAAPGGYGMEDFNEWFGIPSDFQEHFGALDEVQDEQEAAEAEEQGFAGLMVPNFTEDEMKTLQDIMDRADDGIEIDAPFSDRQYMRVSIFKALRFCVFDKISVKMGEITKALRGGGKAKRNVTWSLVLEELMNKTEGLREWAAVELVGAIYCSLSSESTRRKPSKIYRVPNFAEISRRYPDSFFYRIARTQDILDMMAMVNDTDEESDD